MFAKGRTKKRDPSVSDSSFDAVEYGDNVYTLPTIENNNRSSAKTNAAFEEQIHIDNPPKNENQVKKITIVAVLCLAFFVNALIILLLVPNKFTSEISSAIPVALTNIWADISNYSAADIAEQPLELQLKNMALNAMQSNAWNTQKLERMDMSWQSLSHVQQNKIKQEVWFQLFENAIIHELNTFKIQAKTSTTIPTDALALNTLAKSLDVRGIPEYKVDKVDKVDKVKNAKTAARKTRPTLPTNNIKTTPDSTIKTNRTNPVETASKKPNHKNNNTSIPKKKLNPQTKTVAYNQADGPTLSELNDITVQFEDFYEEGNLPKLMSLFSMKAISNRFDNVNDIQQQYANLFNSTSERQIFIRELKWTYSKGKAVGKGKMETLLMTDTNSKVRSSKSRIQLVVEKLGKSTRITRFYELEQ